MKSRTHHTHLLLVVSSQYDFLCKNVLFPKTILLYHYNMVKILYVCVRTYNMHKHTTIGHMLCCLVTEPGFLLIQVHPQIVTYICK